MEHPDEAHHRIHAGHQAPEGGRVEHVGLDDLGGGQRQQLAGTVAAAGGKHQRDPGGGQLAGHGAADKTTTSDDQDLARIHVGTPMRMG